MPKFDDSDLEDGIPMGMPDPGPKKPAPAPPITYVRESWPLKLGMKGDNIRNLQIVIKRMLERKGSVGKGIARAFKIDGYFGPQTVGCLEYLGLPIEITHEAVDLITGKKIKLPDPSKVPTYPDITDPGELPIDADELDEDAKPKATEKVRTTGRKIRIKLERSSGKFTLRPGMIVEEIDRHWVVDNYPLLNRDSALNTGVWVIGSDDAPAPSQLNNKEFTKPNDYTAIFRDEEFEFADTTPETTLLTILSRVEMLDQYDDFSYMLKWIEKCGTKDKDGYDLNWWTEAFCRRLRVPSATHHEYIKAKLQKYDDESFIKAYHGG